MRSPYQGVAIVGAYDTKQARQLTGVTEAELVLDAVRGTLGAAGLAPSDVDGLNVSTWVTRMNPRDAAQWFGGRPVWTGMSTPGVEAPGFGADKAADFQDLEVVPVILELFGHWCERVWFFGAEIGNDLLMRCQGIFGTAELRFDLYFQLQRKQQVLPGHCVDSAIRGQDNGFVGCMEVLLGD